MDRLARSLSFRSDINGLRAYAVIFVVLYHFGVPGFTGGFVGVDVFFVISGFLMTKIITSGLTAGNFSLVGFYLARAKRIVPALVAVCAVLLVLGWFFLSANDYKTLASHSVYSLGFLSNIEYWLEAGYFDADSHTKWLLHTWSLSVEWQFYLILPILLLSAWRLAPSRKTILLLLGAGTLISLGLSIYTTANDASFAFYMLHTRAWEMLAGGLLTLIHTNQVRWSKQAEVTGFILIFLATFMFDQNSAWPGGLAAVPVIGACLIIYAQRGRSFFTGNFVVQRLGDWSYSLYLWHWPLVVSLVYLELFYTPIAVITAVIFTIILGALSHRYIETRARFILNLSGFFRPAAAISILTSIVLLPAIVIHTQQGFADRLPEKVEIAANEAGNRNPHQSDCHINEGTKSPSCIFGGDDIIATVIGDSHAVATVTAVSTAIHNTRRGIKLWSYSGCPTITGAKRVNKPNPNYNCKVFNEWVLQEILEHPNIQDPVVIINRGTYYVKGENDRSSPTYGKPIMYFNQPYKTLNATLLEEYRESLIQTSCAIAKVHPVFLVRPIPEMGINVPKTLAHRFAIGWASEDVSISLNDYHQRHDVTWKAQDEARERCGVKILNPLPYLCDNDRCYGSRAGRPLYYDDDHLSEYGNKLLVPMFEEIFQQPIVRTDFNDRKQRSAESQNISIDPLSNIAAF